MNVSNTTTLNKTTLHICDY